MTDPTRDTSDVMYAKMVKERDQKLEDLERTQAVSKKNIQDSEDINNSKAALAFYLLGDLIDDCIYDVLFEAHREIKLANSTCQICQTKCRSYEHKLGHDVFGHSYNVNNLPSYECVNCQKVIASTRYAPHLEKCLGLAGRQSSRVASRRLGSSPISSDDLSVSDLEHHGEKKKKKISSPLVNGSARGKRN